MSLSNFNEYLTKGIVRKITSNISRASSLIENSQKRKAFLEQIIKNVALDDDNANYFIEAIYDILIEIIRAKLLLAGYEASGNFAHEAEVSYLKELKFSDFEVNLMNELRQFRNGIKYYGKRYKKENAETLIGFLEKIYPKFLKLVK